MSAAWTRPRPGSTGRSASARLGASSLSNRSSGLSRWAGLGALLGGLLTLLVFAPAQWLAQAVHGASDSRVLLTDVRGTLWRGSAQLWLTGGPGSQDRAALPQRIQWTLSPGWTDLTATVQADCCTSQALNLRVTPSWSNGQSGDQSGGESSGQSGGWRAGLRVQLSDSLSVWPAALLTGLGTPWNTLRPDGRLQLSSQGLQAHWSQGHLRLQGSAALELQGLSSALSTLRPMGSYRLSLQTNPQDTPGAPAALALQTLNGSLQLQGSGTLSPALRFSGEASAAPGSEDALGNFLNIVGKRQGARSLITLG